MTFLRHVSFFVWEQRVRKLRHINKSKKNGGETMRKQWEYGEWFVKGILILGLSGSLLTGCGSSKSMEATTSDSWRTSEEVVMYDQKSETDWGGAALDAEAPMAAEESMGTGSVPNIDTSSSYNRKIIKTGRMSVQTKTFNDTVKNIIDTLKKANGYVESMDISGIDYYYEGKGLQSASLTVRIPQQAFDTFMNNSSDFGNVINLSCNTEDITSQYVDAQIHLDVLKTRYDRLLALMKEVDDYDSIFKFEREISEVECEINSYQGTLNHFDSVVDMATIDITISEVREYTKEPTPVITFGDRIAKTLSDSWESVIDFFKGLIILFVCLIPRLLIIVPIVLIVYLIIRKIRAARKKKKQGIVEKENEAQNEKIQQQSEHEEKE